eukprot:m.90780 g.90780  ORF g.90780 m.90780 type:complete len:789 (+) comp9879_c0_seq1:321-2687(+)
MEARHAVAAVDPSGHPLLEELHADELYSSFFEEAFDPSRFANAIIQGSSIAASLEQLSTGIGRLESELHTQVAARHGDLLQQATGIQHLEDVLKMISNRVASLAGSLERMQEKVQKPYTKIVARTTQLSRLQAACELLRRTLRYVHFLRRLQGQLRGGNREIAKAAHTLTELDSLTEGIDLTGIDVVDAEADWIANARLQVRESAEDMLQLSIDAHNQVQLGTALQVFRSLGILGDKVKEIVAHHLNTVNEASRALLNNPEFSDDGTPVAVRRANLWTGMDKLINLICTTTVKMRHLERVLSKKRDHTAKSSYLEELAADSADGVSVVQLYWVHAMGEVKDAMSELGRVCPFIDSAFQNEYPKLLRLFTELCSRISQQGGPDQNVTPQEQQHQDIVACYEAIAPFERAYLSHSLNRMFDPVQLVFTAGSRTPPSVDEVVNICKTMTKELQVISSDARLSVPMARNVARTAKLYFVKTETMIDAVALTTMGEATDSATTANQLRNISLANRLDQLCKGLASIKSSQVGASLSDEGGGIIVDAIAQGHELLEVELLNPIFAAVTQYLEMALKEIRYEDYVAASPQGSAATEEWCSPFLQAFKTKVQHVQQSNLARLTCKDASGPRVLTLAGRLLDIFVRYACMISSISEDGKMRLASDLAQLELALAPLGCNLAEVGPSYRSLRALRQLLFHDETTIKPGDPTIAAMPVSAVLMHMFSRAPSEMRPPHTLRGWTLDAFSAWLDDHTDKEATELVREALEVYASQVAARGDKQFHPVYPIMMQLCDASRDA